MENSSTLEALCNDALYKSTYFTSLHWLAMWTIGVQHVSSHMKSFTPWNLC